MADLESESDRGIAVLCIDDSEDYCSLLGMYLVGRGYLFEGATSGEEALQLLERFTPDVVLLDLTLPDISGLELLATIRERPSLAKTIFVCVSGRLEHEVDWEQAGFHDFVQKPVSLTELDARIVRLQRRP